ncbi:MAG: HAMP domain-containing sensor histidine kinase [Nostocaceae cyanobacterium]|nr:HAMP domain-containing sensor histidine kinase [Nostocaceae cyanobacterium]
MNLSNWIYLGIGVGLGFGLQLLSGRLGNTAAKRSLPELSTNKLPATAPEDKPEHTQELAALRQQIEQMELAYHMVEEMSQFKAGFLARTSHELRSPLNSLIGMHQLILSDLCESPEEEREFVAQANQSALKLIKIIDEILNVSRTEYGRNPLEIQPVQLASALDEVYQLTHMVAENRNFRLQIAPADGEIYILADPNWLRQVLVNLISITILEMEEGSISISTQAESETNVVQIWLDVPLSDSIWSESIDLMYSEYTPSESLNGDSPTSPGMKLWLSQTILKAMQGKMEVIAITPNHPSAENMSRIQLSIPLVTLETQSPQSEEIPS